MNTGLRMTLYLLCVLAGIAGYVSDTWLNVEFIGSEADKFGPVLTTIVIAFCSVLALSAASVAYVSKQYVITVLCSLGFVFSVLWSAPVSISRISAAIETQGAGVVDHNNKISLLRESYQEIKGLRIAESNNGGCKGRCLDLLDRETALVEKIALAGAEKKENVGADKISTYVIPFVEANTVKDLMPFAAVFSLVFLMNGLLSFGVTGLISIADGIKAKKKTVEKVNVPVTKLEYTRPRVTEEIDPIIKILSEKGTLTVTELANLSGNKVPFTSIYVKSLENRGLVSKSRKGKNVFVELVH